MPLVGSRQIISGHRHTLPLLPSLNRKKTPVRLRDGALLGDEHKIRGGRVFTGWRNVTFECMLSLTDVLISPDKQLLLLPSPPALPPPAPHTHFLNLCLGGY